jgi:hypothetical protein
MLLNAIDDVWVLDKILHHSKPLKIQFALNLGEEAINRRVSAVSLAFSAR